MWELDHKEGWALKNWFFQTVVLEKILESLLDSKEIKPVNPKGNQSWTLIGRTDAEAETPILWSPDAKNWFIGKDPDAGKDWGQEEKGMTEDEMVGWHHWLNGHEFEQTLERWWRTRKPRILQSMGSQGFRHNWANEQYGAEASSWFAASMCVHALSEAQPLGTSVRVCTWPASIPCLSVALNSTE